MIDKNAAWFITGCSKGFGRALAEQALDAGYRVVATARNKLDLDDLARRHGDAIVTLSLDVTVPDQIETAVQEAQRHFGGIDVLVNNAGYGYLGAVEEGDDADMRELFETCLFSQVGLIKAVLPQMRERRRGHIVNFSSIGGITTQPGVGYYNMVKAGVEALSDALAKEVAPLGIHVTVVAPGAFRTDFRGPSSVKQAPVRIADYDATAGQSRDRTIAGDGKQPGDPVRGVKAIIEAVEADEPPVHLILGSDALDLLHGKLEEMRRESDAWEAVSRGTDLVAEDA